MSGWLLDTSVVSELRKANPDPQVKAWSDAQAPSMLHLSTVTLAEIRYGVERQQDEAFRAELEPLAGTDASALVRRQDPGH